MSEQNPTVAEIVEAYLREHGYDGLFHAETDCGCFLCDLEPCRGLQEAGMTGECRAGYRQPPNEDGDVFCGPEKPDAEQT